ncbi:unnamed protein product [Gongylonema pulchrum]|uniref:Uncharacterized protein n=1 Tax=Gongylonema pulchrum TaxID=637853 RepID=A0A3P7RFN6_9BILA|nr:unnamed protein product [Gongylonema pulchrum]
MYWDDGESFIDDVAKYPYYHWEFYFVSTNTTAVLYIKPTKINLEASAEKTVPLAAKPALNCAEKHLRTDSKFAVRLLNCT